MLNPARPAAALALALGVAAAGGLPAAAWVLPSTTCPVFPADNVWNADISALPVNAHSGAWMASMGSSSRNLHPDFGPTGATPTDANPPYGIPFNLVDSSHPRVGVAFQYASESDPGPYPLGSDTHIEGGSGSTGDRHALVVDQSSCTLYETWNTQQASNGSWSAGSGAVFHLDRDALRPAGWTSADAAGLPIYPGLLKYDEVFSAGTVRHAIRFTAAPTDTSYLWPARHEAGARSDPSLPPMGARFRLKASFATSGFSAAAQVVLQAMKHYGLILADNGSDWYFQGSADDRWSDAFVSELKRIPAGAFEAVDESSLMVDPGSGAVKTAPPPSAAPAPQPPPRASSPSPVPSAAPSPSPSPSPPPASPTPTPPPVALASASPPAPARLPADSRPAPPGPPWPAYLAAIAVAVIAGSAITWWWRRRPTQGG